MSRTRVKICGITRSEDAQAAVTAGADAIGLVFYAASPRAVTIAQARELCAVLPPFVTPVGLFVDADANYVREVLAQVPLGLLQFHGDESPAYCAGFGRAYLKALRMKDGVDIAQMQHQYAAAAGLLLDSYRPGVPGGTGAVFDWTRIAGVDRSRLVLAGGLNADNVGEGIRQVRPFAVDVSGGVESSPGIKDAQKIRAFVAAVNAADRDARLL